MKVTKANCTKKEKKKKANKTIGYEGSLEATLLIKCLN